MPVVGNTADTPKPPGYTHSIRVPRGPSIYYNQRSAHISGRLSDERTRPEQLLTKLNEDLTTPAPCAFKLGLIVLPSVKLFCASPWKPVCAKDASSPSSVQGQILVVYNYTAEKLLIAVQLLRW